MKTWMAVGAIFCIAGRAFAQQQDDPVERQVQRYKTQLNLTDEQLPKIREIVKKEMDDLHAVLTDEQKTRLDQGGQRGNRAPGAPGGNNAQPGGNFNAFRGALPATTELKTQLNLTDDQVTKINEIRDAARQETRNLFQNRGRRGGNNNNNLQDLAAQMEKSREETNKKIRETLTDEQKPKFDEIVKNAATQTPTPGANGFGGGFGQNRGTIDERVARVMETLKIEEAKEADAVKSLVKKVMEAMDKLDAFQRETRTKVDEMIRNKDLSDQAVGDKIGELAKGHHDLEKDLASARKELMEVVTNRQELELLRRGILR